MKKSVHPASRKPAKAAWAKMGIPVDRKPERAVQAKVRDKKRTAMSRHLVTCLQEEDLSVGSHQAPPQVPSPAETGAIRIVRTIQLLCSPGTKVDSAEECNQDTFTPHRVRQDSAILSPSRVGLQSALKRHNIP